MKQYLDLCNTVLSNGVSKEDRTGTGTVSYFGHQARYNLSEGLPLVTTKKTAFRLIVSELLWFLSGNTNTKALLEDNNHIWDDWADENGDLGPIYGSQWRSWLTYNGKTIDQIAWVIENIKKNPDSRRHIVSAWNVAALDDMALPPCHLLFQFYVSNGKLSCQLYQRSGDVFLGVPFNIASYSLLTMMTAQVCDLEVGEFIHTIGDAHIYKNHIPQILTQLDRKPKKLPTVILNPLVKNIDDFTADDIQLIGYDPHPPLKGIVAV